MMFVSSAMPSETGKKVGIMGGTFNPVHMGHLILAEQAMDHYRLDEILFIPSGVSYMKEQEDVLPAKLRMDMTSLAIEDNPRFALSDLEVAREGNTYTYETLGLLKQTHPETDYYFLAGADSLFHITDWMHPELIFDQCKLIAAVRKGIDEEQCRQKADMLEKQFGADILLLPARNIDISSTEIRERVRSGKSIRYLVPDKVIAYIDKKHLFSE